MASSKFDHASSRQSSISVLSTPNTSISFDREAMEDTEPAVQVNKIESLPTQAPEKVVDGAESKVTNGATTPPAEAARVDMAETVGVTVSSGLTHTPPSTGGQKLRKKKSRLATLTSFFPSLISLSPTERDLPRKPIARDSPIQDKSSASLERLTPTSLSPTSIGASVSPILPPLTGIQSNQDQQKDARSPNMRMQRQAPVQAQQFPPSPPGALDSEISPREPRPSLKLTKTQKRRSSSMHHKKSSSGFFSINQSGGAPRQPSPSPEPRGRSASAHPPLNKLQSIAANRNLSSVALSRPESSQDSRSPSRGVEKRGRLRRSWMPGTGSRSSSNDLKVGDATSAAWILGQNNTDYNTNFLTNGEKVPELWNESGNVLVYLHPKESGRGPSFKVQSFVVDYSLAFADFIDAELSFSPGSQARNFMGRDNLTASDAARGPSPQPPPASSQSADEMKLYIPAAVGELGKPGGTNAQMDLQRLVSIRNLFAFLTGQPLVGTKAQPSLFAVLIRIASLLLEFEFTNADGSTFGEAVEMSFGFLMDQIELGDVRHSREKTLEALVLGERMRSWDLYNEAFAHAVGKYTAIRALNSPLWNEVSPLTRTRLERAQLDLLAKQSTVNNRLEAFEFPALFSGVANSTALTEYKSVKFNIWRKSFGRMKQFVLGYYKTSLGSWPPKARSKKNPFSESGLNAQVLKILYSDLCALYDLLVDREALTSRTLDHDGDDEDASPHVSALRHILSEFDRSSPPVLPPIPFDIPKCPDMTSVKENYYDLPPKEQVRLDKNLQEYEFLLILNKSYDFETFKLKLPFLEEFKEFERKEAKGKSASDMADQRIGYWLFMYVVIQSLPMLVVDAPGLKFTEDVEYFLCQPPKGHPPWMGDVPGVRKRWYEVSGGNGYVELSADAVEFSIEGIYHRSHCWLAAKLWVPDPVGPYLDAPEDALSPLPMPQSVFEDNDPSLSTSPTPYGRSESPTGVAPQLAIRSRNASPSSRHASRSSIALGLEPVFMPPESPMDRPGSRVFSAREGPHAPRSPSVAMNRSRSFGNLNAPATAGSPIVPSTHSRAGSRQDMQGSTFDDILKDIDTKPKKKKTFFG